MEYLGILRKILIPTGAEVLQKNGLVGLEAVWVLLRRLSHYRSEGMGSWELAGFAKGFAKGFARGLNKGP